MIEDRVPLDQFGKPKHRRPLHWYERLGRGFSDASTIDEVMDAVMDELAEIQDRLGMRDGSQ